MAAKKPRPRSVRPLGDKNPYGWRYQQARAALLAVPRPCALQLVCRGDVATTADHDPPLSRHAHVAGSGCCRLQPACAPCQSRQASLLARGLDPTPPRRNPPSREW
jgi:hypothetical protein